MEITSIYLKYTLLMGPILSTLLLFTNSNSITKEYSNRNEVKQEFVNLANDSCVLAISISNFNSYRDYDISIWIQNNYSDTILAPFNLASLLNKNKDNPILNLWVVSPDGRTAYVLKRSFLHDFLIPEHSKDLLFPKSQNTVEENGNIRFKFNIMDIFGSNIPKHDKFFFEYSFESNKSEELFYTDLINRNVFMEQDDFNYYTQTNYNLKNNRLIGNFFSAVAYHKEHLINIETRPN